MAARRGPARRGSPRGPGGRRANGVSCSAVLGDGAQGLAMGREAPHPPRARWRARRHGRGPAKAALRREERSEALLRLTALGGIRPARHFSTVERASSFPIANRKHWASTPEAPRAVVALGDARRGSRAPSTCSGRTARPRRACRARRRRGRGPSGRRRRRRCAPPPRRSRRRRGAASRRPARAPSAQEQGEEPAERHAPERIPRRRGRPVRRRLRRPRGTIRTGISFTPLIRLERSRRGGPSSSTRSKRRSSSSKNTRASRRASFAPRQKCSPKPKATWGLGSRRRSKRSASGNTSSSRFAEE